MSKYVPVKHNTKEQQINWINTLVHVHDLQCYCNKPLEHTIDTIFKQEKNLRLENSTKQNIQKCLTIDTVTIKEEDDQFGDGELEALFAEDGGEENATTATDNEPR